METNLAGVTPGMEVYDTSGDKVGKVADVLSVSAYSTTGAATGTGFDAGATGYTSGVAGEGSYLQVEQGGILGVGATNLYVPFSAVTNIVPGDNLTINCTKDQCGTLYASKPEFLGGNG